MKAHSLSVVCAMLLATALGSCRRHHSLGVTSGVQVSNIAPGSAPVGSLIVVNGTDFSLNPSSNQVIFENGTLGEIQNTTKTKLLVRIPNGAKSGQVRVVVGQKPQLVASHFTVLPTVSAVVPPQAIVGGAVTLTGYNFQEDPTGNIVMVNGVPAEVVAASYNSISIRIPDGMRSGTISVSTVDGTAFGGSFTVHPSILGFNPAVGATNTEVVLSGFNFGLSAADNQVRFANNVLAQVISANYHELHVLVPAGAVTGTISVTTVDGVATTSNDFTVRRVPQVLSASPNSAAPGTAVTITGLDFDVNPAGNTVLINGVPATVLNASENSLTILVPEMPPAAGVTISVTTIGGIGVLNGSFEVLPHAPLIEAFEPVSGAPGAVIRVHGEHFGIGNIEVRVNGLLCTLLSHSDTEALVQLPDGASSGAVQVAVGAQYDISADSFTVNYSRYAFAANRGDHSISRYIVNGMTGELRSNGHSYLDLNSAPRDLALSSNGQFLYSANSGSNKVSAFQLGTNGLLTLIENENVGTQPLGLCMHPNGQFLYVANAGSNNISVLQVAGNGSLSPVSTSAAGSQPQSIAIPASGSFLFVSNRVSNTISSYAIQGSGALLPIEDKPSGTSPAGVTIYKNFLYAANSGSNNVSAYRIEVDGHLTLLESEAVGQSPKSLRAEGTGRFLYVSNEIGDSITILSIAQDGMLSPTGPTVAVGDAPGAIQFDATGKLYVVNASSNDISLFSIDPLTGVAQSYNSPLIPNGRVGTRSNPDGFVITRGSSAVSITPRFAFAANAADTTGGNSISAYQVDSSGLLTRLDADPNSPGQDMATGHAPKDLKVSRSGRFAYVINSAATVNTDNYLSAYRVESNGSLSALMNLVAMRGVAGAHPSAMTIDPSGSLLFVANDNPSTSSTSSSPSPMISVYQIQPEGGAQEGRLTDLNATKPPKNVLIQPLSMGMDANGSYLFVLYAKGKPDPSSGHISTDTPSIISVYRVANNVHGMPLLTRVGDFDFGVSNAKSMLVHPSGKYLYVTSYPDALGAGRISHLRVMGDGSIQVVGHRAAGTKVQGLATDFSGRFLYAANSGENTVSGFQVDASTGNLTQMDAAADVPGIQNFNAGSVPFGLHVDAAGKFLYVSNAAATGAVGTLEIQPNGSLILVPTFANAGKNPQAVASTSTIQ